MKESKTVSRLYRAFESIGDYYTINISCPNAFGGEPFTDRSRLQKLLEAINNEKRLSLLLLKYPQIYLIKN